MFTIQYATAEDCALLSEVFATVVNATPYYNEVAKREEILKFESDSLLDKIKKDPLSVILAKEAQDILGFCFSRFDDYTLWLEWYGVLPQARGKGIAVALLKALEQTVTARNCHKIWCDCRTNNSASIHILEAFGYNQVAMLKAHWYGQDFFLWEKFV